MNPQQRDVYENFQRTLAKLVRERLQLQAGSPECRAVEQRICRIEDIMCSDPTFKRWYEGPSGLRLR
jgi:hypothetical protein